MYIFSMKRASSGLSNCDLTAVLVSTAVDFLHRIYFYVFLFVLILLVFYLIYIFISTMRCVLYIRYVYCIASLKTVQMCNVVHAFTVGYNDFDIF
jgi:hypothetical protein